MTNNTFKKLKEYFEKKENLTPCEEQLLKEINENLEYSICIRINRDTIQQAGFITDNLDDDTIQKIAGKVENGLYDSGFWISLATICNDMEGVYRTDHVFCPKCKSGKTWFGEYDMTYFCDDCNNEFIHFDGMIFPQPLTKLFVEQKLEPFFRKYLPDFEKLIESKDEYSECPRYEVFQKGQRASCITIYEHNKITCTLSSLKLDITTQND